MQHQKSAKEGAQFFFQKIFSYVYANYFLENRFFLWKVNIALCTVFHLKPRKMQIKWKDWFSSHFVILTVAAGDSIHKNSVSTQTLAMLQLHCLFLWAMHMWSEEMSKSGHSKLFSLAYETSEQLKQVEGSSLLKPPDLNSTMNYSRNHIPWNKIIPWQ